LEIAEIIIKIEVPEKQISFSHQTPALLGTNCLIVICCGFGFSVKLKSILK
jgi:hypothetical protein